MGGAEGGQTAALLCACLLLLLVVFDTLLVCRDRSHHAFLTHAKKTDQPKKQCFYIA
jgi:hypothetical protein